MPRATAPTAAAPTATFLPVDQPSSPAGFTSIGMVSFTKTPNCDLPSTVRVPVL